MAGGGGRRKIPCLEHTGELGTLEKHQAKQILKQKVHQSPNDEKKKTTKNKPCVRTCVPIIIESCIPCVAMCACIVIPGGTIQC